MDVEDRPCGWRVVAFKMSIRIPWMISHPMTVFTSFHSTSVHKPVSFTIASVFLLAHESPRTKPLASFTRPAIVNVAVFELLDHSKQLEHILWKISSKAH